ncbi:tRNA epoxyqueuosine(34) reductase QueG [Aureliella helgolandensis]|uniref:Epoxyqueuosine reductase n=1 Tax=Aureliella helgolandensis TaxID=2527968 RepID=A0A518GEH1_9BACT|nr:tRNA epoxyqueuosine(34) reductase QueG [Aureliella helgolandensis]QDV26996.1 Epoxyqueuosine reductase [Aureliella helgolandensis]
MQRLTDELKKQAQELGFVLSGVTASASPGRLAAFHRWLDAGYAGQMHYMHTRREAYADPKSVLEGCRSIVMLALPYTTAEPTTAESPTQAAGPVETPEPAAAPLLVTATSGPQDAFVEQPAAAWPAGRSANDQGRSGRIARYAQGQLDYHDVIHGRLKELIAWLSAQQPTASVRGVVDTAPLLEREFAESAGLGWIGKNTLLLNRQWGSYFFLAALLTDLPLAVDPPQEKGYCGTCTACLQACPTDAFPAPYILDASRCISYLTIEHRDLIAPDLLPSMQNWVFGCDICQEVCPWNRKAEQGSENCFAPSRELQDFDVPQVLQFTDEEFRQHFRKTPLWRSKRRGILRNAILCAGNQRMAQTHSNIVKLLGDVEPLIRGAAAWTLSKLQMGPWREQIAAALELEVDDQVKSAMQRIVVEATPNV